MLDLLEKFFENAHAKKVVAIELLRLGLRVESRGKIFADKTQEFLLSVYNHRLIFF